MYVKLLCCVGVLGPGYEEFVTNDGIVAIIIPYYINFKFSNIASTDPASRSNGRDGIVWCF